MSLESKCKLFLQRQWNSSSWTEIPNADVLHRILLEQMDTKVRVKNSILHMRFSFGRAKSGLAFASQDDVDDYTDELLGNAITFSQDEVPSSPYVRRFGSIKRDSNWNKLSKIMDLIITLYKTTTSKLYYGFLKEHGNSFFRIISANISINKDASPFLPALNDTKTPLSEDIIDEHLLAVYIRSHQNDIPGGPLPDTNNYPPTNETMMITPPTHCEWKASQQRQFEFQHSTQQPTLQHHQSTSVSQAKHSNNETRGDEIMGMTFKAS